MHNGGFLLLSILLVGTCGECPRRPKCEDRGLGRYSFPDGRYVCGSDAFVEYMGCMEMHKLEKYVGKKLDEQKSKASVGIEPVTLSGKHEQKAVEDVLIEY